MNKPYYPTVKDKTILQQIVSLKKLYPDFNLTHDHIRLKAIGEIQPTSRSVKYKVEIKYHLRELPKIRVLNPELVVNYKGEPIPHVYPGNKLCLYRPKYNEFMHTDYLSQTILPWTSLWLYHYEVWHSTGDWLGGGEHPTKTKK